MLASKFSREFQCLHHNAFTVVLLAFAIACVTGWHRNCNAQVSSGVATTTEDDQIFREPANAGFAFIYDDQDTVSVLEGERSILTFQRSTKSKNGKWPRANYVHPLMDLDGHVITEDFPDDHGHHRGVFWAWHQVVIDDAGQPKSLGDAWLCQDFEWKVQQVSSTVHRNVAVLRTATTWKSSKHTTKAGKPIPLVKEKAKIEVHRSQANTQFVDFEISLLALVDGLKIGGSDDTKGYGGFSPRIRMHDKLAFSARDGEVEPVKNSIDAGPWVNISDPQRGIAILSHQDNPNHPQPWILRRARSMQNPVYPGREPVALSTSTPLVLKYRLVIHRGQLKANELDAIYANYVAN